MVDPTIVKAIQGYVTAVRRSGVQVKQAILFGSHARGDAHVDSDIDLLVIAPEFDKSFDRAQVDLLWTLRAYTDSRIEPLAVGEEQWQDDTDSMMIEIARREGEPIPLLVAA